MNTKLVLITMIMAFFSYTSVFGQAKTESFEVSGNCGMCEDRIEAAATSLEGVHSADWNQKTQMLSVSYNPDVLKISKVHKAVADAGHDTKLNKAEEETYKQLPACCQYERKAKSNCGNARKKGCCGRG